MSAFSCLPQERFRDFFRETCLATGALRVARFVNTLDLVPHAPASAPHVLREDTEMYEGRFRGLGLRVGNLSGGQLPGGYPHTRLQTRLAWR